jgi:DNA-directed RNA polymerase specialized sigma subunit
MLRKLKLDEYAHPPRESAPNRSDLPADSDDISLGWLGRYEWLVVREASRYFQRLPSCRDDLLQECRIALLRASELYDDTRGVPFIAYASRVISRAAQKFVIA